MYIQPIQDLILYVRRVSVINNSGLQTKTTVSPKKNKTIYEVGWKCATLKGTYEFLSRFDFLFSRQQQQQLKEKNSSSNFY